MDIKKGDTIKDAYGKTSAVLDTFDNIVWTTAGTYHVTKVWKVQ